MKDYIAISREIRRRGEAKKNARRRHIHHALAACLLLCICVPLGFGVWQLTAPTEAPEPLESLGEGLRSEAPEEPDPETPPGNEEPEYSEEPWEEEPVYSEEPAEEPDYSEELEEPQPEEPSEEPPAVAPEEPDESPLPEGVTVEMHLFGQSNPDGSNDAVVGYIGVMENGKWSHEKGYILLTDGERIPNGESGDGASLLQRLCADAGIDFPSHSLTAEEGERLLERLLDYYS